MKINGDAIYGTRAIAPYFDSGVRFTQKDRRVFAFLVDETANRLKSLRPAPGATLSLLGSETPVTWTEVDGECVFVLPDGIDHLPRPLTLSFGR
jgi:alpha-L-fucosidase